MTALAILEALGFFVLLPIIVGLIIISLVMILKQTRQRIFGNIKDSIENLVCSIDADCPSGYVCIDGKCAPSNNINDSISLVS